MSTYSCTRISFDFFSVYLFKLIRFISLFLGLSVSEGSRSIDKQSMSMSRGHWRPEEDEKLKDLVARFGPHNWNTIAENIPGRTGAVIL